jgi:hypothetical protein
MNTYLFKQKKSTPSHVFVNTVRKIIYIGVYSYGDNFLSYFLRTASLTVTFV